MNDSAPAALTCPTCGLTAIELRDTGRMGCAQCYHVFSAMVAQAVAVLHHVSIEPVPAEENPSQNPWPTRRAETSPSPRRG
jgi:protein arginine kinase activator